MRWSTTCWRRTAAGCRSIAERAGAAQAALDGVRPGRRRLTSPTYHALRQLVDSLPVASSHEHLLPDDVQQRLTLDSLLFNSYVKMLDLRPGDTAEEHGRFLDACRQNGLFNWLERALREIYTLEAPLDPANWEAVSERIAARHVDPEAHLTILRQHAKYRRAIQDAYWDYGSDNGHPELLSPTLRTDMFTTVYHPDLADHDGNCPFRAYPQAPRTGLGDYLAFIEELFRGWRQQGGVALKSALAYERSLDFGTPDRALAEGVFLRDPARVGQADRLAFGNFMFHWFCDLAARLEVPFQVHTGIGRLRDSAPMLLEPALAAHPGTRFVLFHVGYPWYDAVAGLAHSFANVVVDLVWVPLLSVSGAASALHELLDVARSGERICWGGDARTAEEALGALLAWRHVVARVLSEKVEEGYLDMGHAERLAHGLMYSNVARLYGLDLAV